jgi:hypothetical protein
MHLAFHDLFELSLVIRVRCPIVKGTEHPFRFPVEASVHHAHGVLNIERQKCLERVPRSASPANVPQTLTRSARTRRALDWRRIVEFTYVHGGIRGNRSYDSPLLPRFVDRVFI